MLRLVGTHVVVLAGRRMCSSEEPNMTALQECSISLKLSETVPPTNSDESGRSGGAYASLGTRQERAEGVRMLA